MYFDDNQCFRFGAGAGTKFQSVHSPAAQLFAVVTNHNPATEPNQK
jgi:hypothetical protein